MLFYFLNDKSINFVSFSKNCADFKNMQMLTKEINQKSSQSRFGNIES